MLLSKVSLNLLHKAQLESDRILALERKIRVRSVGPLARNGPVPWNWLQAAMARPEPEGMVALALWIRAAFEGDRALDSLLKDVVPLGLKRPQILAALRGLASAGLVRLQPSRSKPTTITLLIADHAERIPSELIRLHRRTLERRRTNRVRHEAFKEALNRGVAVKA